MVGTSNLGSWNGHWSGVWSSNRHEWDSLYFVSKPLWMDWRASPNTMIWVYNLTLEHLNPSQLVNDYIVLVRWRNTNQHKPTMYLTYSDLSSSNHTHNDLNHPRIRASGFKSAEPKNKTSHLCTAHCSVSRCPQQRLPSARFSDEFIYSCLIGCTP